MSSSSFSLYLLTFRQIFEVAVQPWEPKVHPPVWVSFYFLSFNSHSLCFWLPRFCGSAVFLWVPFRCGCDWFMGKYWEKDKFWSFFMLWNLYVWIWSDGRIKGHRIKFISIKQRQLKSFHLFKLPWVLQITWFNCFQYFPFLLLFLLIIQTFWCFKKHDRNHIWVFLLLIHLIFWCIYLYLLYSFSIFIRLNIWHRFNYDTYKMEREKDRACHQVDGMTMTVP